MASALGILKWTPNTFWGATIYEYTAAMKGHLSSQGVDIAEPMTRNEYLDLEAQDKLDQQAKRKLEN